MVEGSSLENCRTGNGTVGSNPTLSATIYTRLAESGQSTELSSE